MAGDRGSGRTSRPAAGPLEDPGLDRLGDTPIDEVLAAAEADSADYRALYYLWERQQWEAGAIDLTEDRRHWAGGDVGAEQKRSFLWGLSPCYVGAERVVECLVPFVDAAPTEEQQVFLTTQLVDGARHTVFFDRFYDEVVAPGDADMRARLERQADLLSGGFRTLLLEMLPEAATEIRRDPQDPSKLVEGVVLSHIVIEGALAVTGQKFLLDHLREEQLLPGFRRGFTAVARDGARHVNFGVRLLQEMVSRDPRYADVIRSVLSRIAPVALTVLEPPHGDMSYYDPLPYGPEELSSFAIRSLEKRLGVIGVPFEGGLA